MATLFLVILEQCLRRFIFFLHGWKNQTNLMMIPVMVHYLRLNVMAKKCSGSKNLMAVDCCFLMVQNSSDLMPAGCYSLVEEYSLELSNATAEVLYFSLAESTDLAEALIACCRLAWLAANSAAGFAADGLERFEGSFAFAVQVQPPGAEA
jgi:hypothetical protein